MPMAAYMAENSTAATTASNRRPSHTDTKMSATKKPSTAMPTDANHLSCWRSCPLARRNRTAIDTAESAKVAI
jgi:hypothetical protein